MKTIDNMKTFNRRNLNILNMLRNVVFADFIYPPWSSFNNLQLWCMDCNPLVNGLCTQESGKEMGPLEAAV